MSYDIQRTWWIAPRNRNKIPRVRITFWNITVQEILGVLSYSESNLIYLYTFKFIILAHELLPSRVFVNFDIKETNSYRKLDLTRIKDKCVHCSTHRGTMYTFKLNVNTWNETKYNCIILILITTDSSLLSSLVFIYNNVYSTNEYLIIRIPTKM